MSEMMEAYDALIEHAARYWAAEEENARRRAARVNLLLTVSVAVIGLGLYKLGTDILVMRLDPPWAEWLLRGFLIAALLSFVVSIWHLLHVRVRPGRPVSTTPSEEGDRDRALEETLRGHALDASFKLRLTPSTFTGFHDKLPEPGTPEWVKLTIFFQIYEAADDLTERNAHEKWRINLGQLFLLIGVVLIVFALCTYTLFSDGFIT